MKGEGDVVSGLKEWADFLGAGLLRCTGEMDRQPLSPASLAMAAVPWAILTSALEWFILVPLFPFWQRIFTLQQPYWIGFLVGIHARLASSLGFRTKGVRGQIISWFGALSDFRNSACGRRAARRHDR
jgi:hypothetical protein